MKTGLITARNKYVLSLILGSLLIFGSCVDTKKVTYFRDLGEGVIPSSAINLEPVINKSDILSISVTSPNPDATVMFNAPNMAANQTSAAAGNIAPSSGYLVNQDGFIEFPALGKIVAAGVTKQKLKEEIISQMKKKIQFKNTSKLFLHFQRIRRLFKETVWTGLLLEQFVNIYLIKPSI